MSMNMPFEPQDETALPTEGVMLSGGCVVAAIFIGHGPLGKLPALMFRFAKPDGTGFYPATVLACDDFADLHGLAPLIQSAVNHLDQVRRS